MSSRSILSSIFSSSSRSLTRSNSSSLPLRPLSFLTSSLLRSPSSLLPTTSPSSSSSNTSLSRRPYSSQLPLSSSSSKNPTKKPKEPEEAEEEDDDPSSSSSSSSPPPNASLSQKFKHLSKKYGWWAVGTYTVLGLFDFGVAFVGVGLLGAERVAAVERKVVGWGYEQLGWEMKEGTMEEEKEHRGGGSGGIWTQVAVAYTIHKTLFLPVRLALTGAVLPRLVAYMTRIGWAGKGARGVQVKVQAVQAKVKQAVKERVP